MDALDKAVAQAVVGVKNYLEGRIDYGGQSRAERINKQILIASGVAAFIVGFAWQSVVICMATYIFGLLASAAVIVPPWPYLRQHPIAWLPPIPEDLQGEAPPGKKRQ